MTKCLVDKDTVEKIHALKKRKQGVRNAGRNDLYDPFQTYKGFYTLSSFSGETMTYIYRTIYINSNFCQKREPFSTDQALG